MDGNMADDLTLDMIPECYRDIAEVAGVRVFISLCKKFGGTSLYFPKSGSVTRPARDMHIRSEFDGGNYRQLACRYGLCETQVRKIVAEKD